MGEIGVVGLCIAVATIDTGFMDGTLHGTSAVIFFVLFLFSVWNMT